MAQIQDTDFSMKPSVDISGIASILQRKKIAEIEAQQAQRAQRMNELSTTIGLASNLASNMVEHSKERQKQAFIKSLSESMAASVPLQDDGQPNTKQMSLMQDATRVAPDKAADYAFKLANPTLGNDSLGFQRMTFTGSNGKTKTLNVGVLGTQLVNPLTLKPFSGSPEEVDTMPEYGFVEREEYAGTDEQGNPVYRNPVENTTYVKDAQGNPVPYRGPIMPKLANPGEAMTNKVQFIGETRDILNEAIEKFEPAFVGPVAGRVAPIREWFSGMTDEKQVEFNQLLGEIDAIKRHELYGSALSVGEQAFFNQISLNTKISPEAFLARLKAAKRKLDLKEKNLLRAAKATGKVIRGTGAQPVDLGEGFEGFSFVVEEE